VVEGVPNLGAAVSDAELIDEALAGNAEAFGGLVTKYQDRLYNTVVHVVGSTEDARDVVQDAFVQAFVKLETFRRDSAFYTWLYRIAFNVGISHLRRKKPTASIDQIQEDAGQQPIDDVEAPSDRMEQQERAVRIRAGLEQLNEQHRTILVLREIDGSSYEQISEILSLPVGTVRSRLHRARMQLRDQLKEMLQEDLQ
jgi:RNA polymerase sigma-70 factor (ECF subfamily)